MFKKMSMDQVVCGGATGGYGNGKLQNTPSCIVACRFNATAEAKVHHSLGPTHEQ